MSRGTQERQQKRHLIFGYGTITHLGSYFHRIHLTKYFFTLLSTEVETLPPYDPQPHLATLEWNFQFLIYNLQIDSLKIQ